MSKGEGKGLTSTIVELASLLEKHNFTIQEYKSFRCSENSSYAIGANTKEKIVLTLVREDQ